MFFSVTLSFQRLRQISVSRSWKMDCANTFMFKWCHGSIHFSNIIGLAVKTESLCLLEGVSKMLDGCGKCGCLKHENKLQVVFRCTLSYGMKCWLTEVIEAGNKMAKIVWLTVFEANLTMCAFCSCLVTVPL